MEFQNDIACYEVFELVLDGPSAGNPFTDVSLDARFEEDGRSFQADGFYDGEGLYRVRFIPDRPGEWHFTTRSSSRPLDGLSGTFHCIPPRPGVHGPVRVANQFHFAYADGTPYMPFGTTCYAWAHQGDALEEQTLETLKASPFNKVRMCVFPKSYRYNTNEPERYPFAGTPLQGWDYTRFDPAYFRHFEQRVRNLMDLDIQADLILFHPYDRWGFAHMGRAADERYLRYLTARLSAFRNVWWSLANEYDLLRDKTMPDWDSYFQLIQQHDPSNHLRSIHNWQGLDTHDTRTFYNHARPWVTHCSIQHGYLDLVSTWREQYGKPVVVDECFYEGNLPNGWGNISAEDMLRRFWEGLSRGGYVGHGETYLDPNDVIWWSKGGQLKGKSPARISFLRQVLASLPPGGISPVGEITDTHLPSGGQPGKFYLTYFGSRQPAQVTVSLPEADGEFTAWLIDTWGMNITPLQPSFHGSATFALPGKPYQALLVTPTWRGV